MLGYWKYQTFKALSEDECGPGDGEDKNKMIFDIRILKQYLEIVKLDMTTFKVS